MMDPMGRETYFQDFTFVLILKGARPSKELLVKKGKGYSLAPSVRVGAPTYHTILYKVFNFIHRFWIHLHVDFLQLNSLFIFYLFLEATVIIALFCTKAQRCKYIGVVKSDPKGFHNYLNGCRFSFVRDSLSALCNSSLGCLRIFYVSAIYNLSNK